MKGCAEVVCRSLQPLRHLRFLPPCVTEHFDYGGSGYTSREPLWHPTTNIRIRNKVAEWNIAHVGERGVSHRTRGLIGMGHWGRAGGKVGAVAYLNLSTVESQTAAAVVL